MPILHQICNNLYSFKALQIQNKFLLLVIHRCLFYFKFSDLINESTRHDELGVGSISNRDRADPKQLKWEMNRDDFGDEDRHAKISRKKCNPAQGKKKTLNQTRASMKQGATAKKHNKSFKKRASDGNTKNKPGKSTKIINF